MMSNPGTGGQRNLKNQAGSRTRDPQGQLRTHGNRLFQIPLQDALRHMRTPKYTAKTFPHP